MSEIRFTAAILLTCTCLLSFSIAQQGEASKPDPGPAITFKLDKAPGSIRESPDNSVELKITGSTAQLFPTDRSKPRPAELYHDPSRIRVNPRTPLTITCWAFSPNGKLLATGASYKRVIGGTVQENEGEVRVWEVATGNLVATQRKGLGKVHQVAFNKDGTTVLIEAEQFDFSGK